HATSHAGAPVVHVLLEPLHGAALRRVGQEAALLQVLLVERNDILRHGSLLVSSCALCSTILRSISGSSLELSREMRSSCIASQAIEPSRLSQIWKKSRRSAYWVSTMRR